MGRWQALRQRPALRYLVVGGSVYLFELAVIVAAQAMGASALWAVALSYILGTAMAFWLQKFVTFGDKRLHHRIVVPQLMATAMLLACNFGVTLVLVRLLEHSLPAVAIRTLALAMTTTWNFYLYKTRIFATPDVPVY